MTVVSNIGCFQATGWPRPSPANAESIGLGIRRQISIFDGYEISRPVFCCLDEPYTTSNSKEMMI